MLAFSKTNEDDLLISYLVTDHSIVCALQVKQYGNRPGARVFWGGTKTLQGTFTQPRPYAFGMLQQSGEYFARNSMLSSFGMDFALKFGGEHQKTKGLHRKILS